jgi:AraC family transcriptional regulator
MSKRKPLDISELYDELRKLGGTYALSIDIVNFMHTNEVYGYAAGDIVIAETFARIEHELTDDMLLFRIGGDEFAVITTYKNVSDADLLARRIIAKNGGTIKVGEHDISLSLRIGISQIQENTLSYHKALAILNNAIEKARSTSDYIAIYDI